MQWQKLDVFCTDTAPLHPRVEFKHSHSFICVCSFSLSASISLPSQLNSNPNYSKSSCSGSCFHIALTLKQSLNYHTRFLGTAQARVYFSQCSSCAWNSRLKTKGTDVFLATSRTISNDKRERWHPIFCLTLYIQLSISTTLVSTTCFS